MHDLHLIFHPIRPHFVAFTWPMYNVYVGYNNYSLILFALYPNVPVWYSSYAVYSVDLLTKCSQFNLLCAYSSVSVV